MLDFYCSNVPNRNVYGVEFGSIARRKKNYLDNLEHIYFYQISFIQDIEIYLKISGSYIINAIYWKKPRPASFDFERAFIFFYLWPSFGNYLNI